MDELQAIAVEWQGAEERRADGQRMDCRTDVADEAREGQFCRPGAAANHVLRLQNVHRFAGLGESNRRCQPIGAGANHDGIEHAVDSND